MIDRHVLILRLADLDRRAEWDGHILLVETTAAGAQSTIERNGALWARVTIGAGWCLCDLGEVARAVVDGVVAAEAGCCVGVA
jgi:hypothetical protein